MKLLDLINEAETDQEKNRRHQKDLDDLERDIRKSGQMDKETEKQLIQSVYNLRHNEQSLMKMLLPVLLVLEILQV